MLTASRFIPFGVATADGDPLTVIWPSFYALFVATLLVWPILGSALSIADQRLTICCAHPIQTGFPCVGIREVVAIYIQGFTTGPRRLLAAIRPLTHVMRLHYVEYIIC